MLGAASLMGLAFNGSNPLGVRWGSSESPDRDRVAVDEVPSAELVSVTKPAPAVAAPAAETPQDTNPVAVAVSSGNLAEAAALAGRPVFAAPSQTTWAEVKPLAEQGNVVLVDARAKPAYDAGHIPGAILLPEDSNDEAIKAFREQVGADAHLVIYCSSTSCSLSFKLAYRLAKDYGFTHVQFMTGGYLEYQRAIAQATVPPATVAAVAATTAPAAPASDSAASNPATTAAVAPSVAASPPSASTASPVPAPAPVPKLNNRNPTPMSWRRAAEWRETHGAMLVDTRPAAEFLAGHIPGAISLPANAGEEQVAVFAAENPKDKPLILYGRARGDLQAFMTARKLLQERGFENVNFTDEGYAEWLAGPNPNPDSEVPPARPSE